MPRSRLLRCFRDAAQDDMNILARVHSGILPAEAVIYQRRRA